MVVPISRSRAPLRTRMSGIRKEPPISISSPREITTSRPEASAAQRQQQRPRRIVHRQGVLRAGDGAKRLAAVVSPAAASAGVQVELQVAVPGRDRCHRRDGRRRQRRTAEVGVEHDAGGIEQRPEARSSAVGEALAHIGGPVLGRPGPTFPRRRKRFPDGVHHRDPGRRSQELLNLRVEQQTVDRGETAPRVAHWGFVGAGFTGAGFTGVGLLGVGFVGAALAGVEGAFGFPGIGFPRAESAGCQRVPGHGECVALGRLGDHQRADDVAGDPGDVPNAADLDGVSRARSPRDCRPQHQLVAERGPALQGLQHRLALRRPRAGRTWHSWRDRIRGGGVRRGRVRGAGLLRMKAVIHGTSQQRRDSNRRRIRQQRHAHGGELETLLRVERLGELDAWPTRCPGV